MKTTFDTTTLKEVMAYYKEHLLHEVFEEDRLFKAEKKAAEPDPALEQALDWYLENK